jgi:hypothetical protein
VVALFDLKPFNFDEIITFGWVYWEIPTMTGVNCFFHVRFSGNNLFFFRMKYEVWLTACQQVQCISFEEPKCIKKH